MRIRSVSGALLLAVSLMVACAAKARADSSAIRGSDNEIWGSVGGSFLNYKEEIPSPYLSDSEHGTIPSVAAGISVLGRPGQGLASNLYFALEGSGAFGQANYYGALSDTPTTLYQSTTNEHIWTVDGKVGKAFPVGPAAMLIPYADIGYRYWSRGVGMGSPYGYTEDYQNGDLLAGLMLQVAPTSRLVLTGYGAAGTTFSPQMATGGYTYDLDSAGAYKLGGKVGFAVTQQVELFTTLDYDAFRYGQSQAVTTDTGVYYEPTSHTEETVWRVGIGYHFN